MLTPNNGWGGLGTPEFKNCILESIFREGEIWFRERLSILLDLIGEERLADAFFDEYEHEHLNWETFDPPPQLAPLKTYLQREKNTLWSLYRGLQETGVVAGPVFIDGVFEGFSTEFRLRYHPRFNRWPEAENRYLVRCCFECGRRLEDTDHGFCSTCGSK